MGQSNVTPKIKRIIILIELKICAEIQTHPKKDPQKFPKKDSPFRQQQRITTLCKKPTCWAAFYQRSQFQLQIETSFSCKHSTLAQR